MDRGRLEKKRRADVQESKMALFFSVVENVLDRRTAVKVPEFYRIMQ